MLHVAIILDGNGRWASLRALPRLAGHRRGAEAVRRVLQSAPALGVTDLTVYAFSSDNWRRPAGETSGLMRLLAEFVEREKSQMVENGVRFTAVGRRDRMPDFALRAIEEAETATAQGERLHFRAALDYSSRDALLEAADHGPRTREELQTLLGIPDVDLLIRTAGEQRLSDFLLWECAYAEFHFTPVLWPDFSGEDLAEALRDFGSRERRFGGLPCHNLPYAPARLPARGVQAAPVALDA